MLRMTVANISWLFWQMDHARLQNNLPVTCFDVCWGDCLPVSELLVGLLVMQAPYSWSAHSSHTTGLLVKHQEAACCPCNSILKAGCRLLSSHGKTFENWVCRSWPGVVRSCTAALFYSGVAPTHVQPAIIKLKTVFHPVVRVGGRKNHR